MMLLELATAEYIGARAQQQDLAAAMKLSHGAVLVLADGLGGHESGAEASRIVVETFKAAGASGLFDNPATRRQALRDTLDHANARIAEGVDPAHGHRGMASTVVAAVVSRGELSWVSVGDSHLYVWRGGRLDKLNEDHSQAGLMVRSGQYHPNDPEVQAVKSVLVSALTGRKLEIVDLPQTTFRLQPGDVLMLASDGLNTLPDDEIEGMVGELRQHGAVKLSTALLERVRSRRVERQDNTTVAVARVLEPVRAEEPAGRAAPDRTAGEAGNGRPAARPLPIDDALEVRTERIVPWTEKQVEQVATGEQATMPVPRPVAAAVEAAVARQSEPAGAPAAPAEPEAPEKSASGKPPELAAASPATDAPGDAQPVIAEAVAEVAQTHAEKPLSAAGKPRVEQRKPLLDARPAGKPNGARLVPEGWREVEVAAELPDKAPTGPQHETASPKVLRAKPLLARPILGIFLLVLIGGSVAIAAIAALKPEWLSDVVPGFGSREIPASPASRDSGAKPAAANPIAVPSPVPAVRPSSSQSSGLPDAAAAAGSNGERRLGDDQTLPPPLSATSPAEVSTPVDPAASGATAPSIADPPLVEPERPATRPPGPGRTQ